MQVANAPCSWGLPDRDAPGEMIGYRQMLDELAAKTDAKLTVEATPTSSSPASHQRATQASPLRGPPETIAR